MDQTTVGRRVGALEEQLGAKLFRRGRDGLTLTPAGEEVLVSAREMDRAAQTLDLRVQGRDRQLEGAVRLTTVETFGGAFLVPRLAAFAKKHPRISLSISTTNRSLNLSRREADIAVRLWRPTQPGLICRKLGEYAYGLYASKGYLEAHPEPVTEWKSHRFIGLDESLAELPEAKWLAERARNMFALRVNRFSVAEQAAVAGLGLAVLPCYVGDNRDELVRVGGRELQVSTRELWLAVHSEMHEQARIRAVSSFIADEVASSRDALLGRGRAKLR